MPVSFLFRTIQQALGRISPFQTTKTGPTMAEVKQGQKRLRERAAKQLSKEQAGKWMVATAIARQKREEEKLRRMPAKEIQDQARREQYDPEERWLHSGEYRPVDSSNVDGQAYFLDKEELLVGFHGGDKSKGITYYVYFSVTEEEARDFYGAPSKGSWVWDHLRIRGTSLGHQKDYAVASDPNRRLNWRRNNHSVMEHLRESDTSPEQAREAGKDPALARGRLFRHIGEAIREAVD